MSSPVVKIRALENLLSIIFTRGVTRATRGQVLVETKALVRIELSNINDH